MSHPAVNGSLSTNAVNAIVHFYGAKIGVSKLAPHDLRRSYARLARDGGASLETVQASLGHASIVTTTRYIQSTQNADAGSFIDVEGGGK